MRIACLLDSDFEDMEFRKPYDALRAAGHRVTVIGLERGRELVGKRRQDRIPVDVGIGEASDDDYDGLLIPGGYSPDHLRADERIIMFTRAFFDRERPVFAVCTVTCRAGCAGRLLVASQHAGAAGTAGPTRKPCNLLRDFRA